MTFFFHKKQFIPAFLLTLSTNLSLSPSQTHTQQIICLFYLVLLFPSLSFRHSNKRTSQLYHSWSIVCRLTVFLLLLWWKLMSRCDIYIVLVYLCNSRRRDGHCNEMVSGVFVRVRFIVTKLVCFLNCILNVNLILFVLILWIRVCVSLENWSFL